MRLVPLLTLALAIAPQLTGAAQVCTVESATNQIQITEIEREGRSAHVRIQIIKELEAINRKATDARRPLSDQLAPRDAARFAELSQRMQSLQLASYVESARSRDAGIVQQMFAAARKFY